MQDYPVVSLPGQPDSPPLTDILEMRAERGSLRVGEPPRATVRFRDPNGHTGRILSIGAAAKPMQGERPIFPGQVEGVEVDADAEGATTLVTLTHEPSHRLRRLQPTRYNWDEDGLPETTRDSVRFNPWNDEIVREPGGTLDVDGLEPEALSVSLSERVRSLAGDRFTFLHDFRDNRLLRASQVYATTNTLQVYEGGVRQRPALARIFVNGSPAPTSTPVESIPLWNGDQNVHVMGDISAVTVTLIGEASAGSNILLEATRNADEADDLREYTTVALTRIDNFNGTGLTAWTGTLTFSDAPVTKNTLGYRFDCEGDSALYAIKSIATITSSTGITVGNIESNTDPSEGDYAAEEDYLQALDAAQQQSFSEANPNGRWDLWVDDEALLHFRERRGSIRDLTYTLEDGTVGRIRHERWGRELAYQTIALGAGSADQQTVIVSKAPFTQGGLYDFDRDPTTDEYLIDLRRPEDATMRLGFDVDGDPDQQVRYAQSFTAIPDAAAKAFSFAIKRVGVLSGNVTVRLSRNPYTGGTVKTFDAGSVPPTRSVHEETFTDTLVAGKKYYLSVEYGGGTASTYLELSRTDNSRLSDGELWRGDEPVGDNELNCLITLQRSGAVLYGGAGRSMRFEDQAEGGPSALLRRARADHRLNREPRENLSVTFHDVGVATLGDTINVVDAPTDTLSSARIVDHATRWSANQGWEEDVTLGTPQPLSFADIGRSIRRPVGALRRGQPFSLSKAGEGRVAQFDATLIAQVPIEVPDPTNVERVLVDIVPVPWQAAVDDAGTLKNLVFDGDSGDGTGTPIYAAGIGFAVDATATGATPTQTQFDAVKHPSTFGSESEPSALRGIDVTGSLRRGANGVIAPGTHYLSLQAGSSASNSNGIAAVNVQVHVIGRQSV